MKRIHETFFSTCVYTKLSIYKALLVTINISTHLAQLN